MRTDRQFAFAVLAVIGLCTPGRTASAQSLLESIFGFGSSRSQPPRSQYIEPRQSFRSAIAMEPERGTAVSGTSKPEASETFQTMCVRTCDGYYWPVHYPATAGDLKADADICTATCGSETKLYTRAGPGTEPEEMRDADGNSYGASSTAFLYRKRLVNGCACRPMPWSAGERARHEAYALAEAEKALRLAQAEAERIAAETAAAKLANNPLLVPDFKVATAAFSSDHSGGAATDVPIGPAEAAAIAAFVPAIEDGAGQLNEVVESPVRPKSKRVASRNPGRERATSRRFVEASYGVVIVPAKNRRGQRVTAAPATPVYAGSKPWSLF